MWHKAFQDEWLFQPILVLLNCASTCFAEPGEEVPTKCVSEHVTLSVKCSISFIDFEGRSDGESMLKIVQQIKPREVILIRGELKTTKRFADQIKK